MYAVNGFYATIFLFNQYEWCSQINGDSFIFKANKFDHCFDTNLNCIIWIASFGLTFAVDNNCSNNAFVRWYSLQSFFDFLWLQWQTKQMNHKNKHKIHSIEMSIDIGFTIFSWILNELIDFVGVSAKYDWLLCFLSQLSHTRTLFWVNS